jgi:hypothetical protein
LFALESNSLVENRGFGACRQLSPKLPVPQVTHREWVTTEKFAPDFHLTGEPLGNKIQLPKFLTVAIPSKLILPSNITPGRTGGFRNAHPSG